MLYAKIFDSLIEDWIRTEKSDILLDKAASIVNQALSCGFTGFVLLEAILKENAFIPQVLGSGIADYFGMLVAQFL